ncbi:MAG: DUF2332 domain-containing protein [Sporichthyaceae bacterium]
MPIEELVAPAPLEVLAHLRRHVAACHELGSPIYAGLLAHAVLDYQAGGPTAAAFEGFVGDPVRAGAALRLLGTVHGFALAGEAPDLARFYPSVRGRDAEPFDAAAAWAAFRDVLVHRMPDVRAGLAQAPQTNEINRCAALAGGLLVLAGRFNLPVRLLELGASAGLNLRPDLVRFELADGSRLGPSDSPVRLPVAWAGNRPRIAPLNVVSRSGVDRDPVDVATPEGRRRLTAFVWPDQIGRLARLRAAIDLALAHPVYIRRQRAASTLGQLQPAQGSVTVVWHSLFWQYVSEGERTAVNAGFAALGDKATAQAPLARLSLEPRGRNAREGVEFVLRLQTWPGAGVELLGIAHPHSAVITWA